MGLETVTNIADFIRTNPTGADPISQGDNHIQNIKIALTNDFCGFTGAVCITGVDGGVADAYTLTPAVALPAYGTKMLTVFAPTVNNTGACTLNVSGLGVKNLRSVSGAALVAGDLVVGNIYVALYTGTEFRLTSITKNYADQLAFGAALPAQPGGATPYELRSLAGVASWILGGLVRSARVANAILTGADIKQLIDITAGTFTQTFTAAATLGSGWSCYIRNSGTGDITLDPNGAELIDGLASYIMYPNEVRLVLCDGVGFTSLVLNKYARSCASTVVLTNPPGYFGSDVEMWGAGSGGGSGGVQGSGDAKSGGTGGSGGGYLRRTFTAAEIGATITLTIGAGGNGGAAKVGAGAGTAGTAGGNSTYGTLLTVTGGAISAGGAVTGGAASAGLPGSTIVTSTSDPIVGGSGGGTSNSASSAGVGKMLAGAGGGGGGGEFSDDTFTSAGPPKAGGARNVASVGGGTAGTSVAAAPVAGGNGAAFAGGGGGGAATTVNAAAGGAGGTASGGGGGGSARTGFSSGAGGAGGNGFAIVRGV